MCGIGLSLHFNSLSHESPADDSSCQLIRLIEGILFAGNEKHLETSLASHEDGTKTAAALPLNPEFIKERGPSFFQHLTMDANALEPTIVNISQEIQGDNTQESAWNMHLLSSVLDLRGNHLSQQPQISKLPRGTFSDNSPSQTRILMWNGEYYGPEDLGAEGNDTEFVSGKLKEMDSVEEMTAFMAAIRGEYAFVYIIVEHGDDGKQTKGQILFGRDPRGRRSLLFDYSKDSFLISSVGLPFPVDTQGLYTLSWKSSSLEQDFSFDLRRIQWENILPSDHPQILSQLCETDPQYNEKEFQLHSKHFYESLREAVRRRVCNIHDPLDTCCSVGILFSGGIDSVIITALAAEVLPETHSLELMNISFAGNACADRKQALRAHQELKRVYPKRNFRLVLSDISKEELNAHREKIVSLLFPRDTVIDFNIGASFYFAARGEGRLYDSDAELEEQQQQSYSSRDVTPSQCDSSSMSETSYTSKCRVLLSGIGSDEFLAGYRRHRGAFQKGGSSRLLQELYMDQERLWIRNLGRDDRVISSSGRELRMPFLDESFLTTVRKIPLHYICDMDRNSGEGDKRILREVAREYCHLEETSAYVKRAVQFGSGIAKISFKKMHADTKIHSVTEKKS